MTLSSENPIECRNHDAPVICLFGAGGHGLAIAAFISKAGKRFVFGDSNSTARKTGPTQIQYDSIEEVREPIIVSIGDNATRRQLQLYAESVGKMLDIFVCSPNGCHAKSVGDGSQLMFDAVANPGSIIGKGVILNTRAIVEHDANIMSFAHVGPGAIVGANAEIGTGVFIGTGAIILPGVNIHDWSVIGAGCIVTRDILDSGTYAGIPARKLSKNGDGQGE